MKGRGLKNIIFGVVALFAGLIGVTNGVANAVSEISFSLSPMNEAVTLNPGDHHRSSFTIYNVMQNAGIQYEVTVKPYYVNDDNVDLYDLNTDKNLITNWITVAGSREGELAAGEKRVVEFSVDVPEGAPAGGQYAALVVTSKNSSDADDDSVGINEEIAIAYLFYAEITGDVVRRGEVIDASLQGFLLSGDIKGASLIKNTGNVHGFAKYTLQVFPLFSDEEIYTNAEKPESAVILPDRTLYNETIMPNTPAIGIFNVVYTVEFEGVKTQVSKVVIKCPIWLLSVIIFAIIAIAIWVVIRIRNRRHGIDRY